MKGQEEVSPVKEKPLLLCDRLFNERVSKVFLEYDSSTPLEIRAFGHRQGQETQEKSGEENSRKGFLFLVRGTVGWNASFYYSIAQQHFFQNLWRKMKEIIFTHGRPDHGYGDCCKPTKAIRCISGFAGRGI